MLTKTDILKIKELFVDVATKEDLEVIKTDVGILKTDVIKIKSDMNKLRREQKSMSAILAIDLSHHAKRLDRLEDTLHLAPLKVPELTKLIRN